MLVTIFPSLLFATALVPANTLMAHFFIWNVLTAPFVETSFIGVTVACGVTESVIAPTTGSAGWPKMCACNGIMSVWKKYTLRPSINDDSHWNGTSGKLFGLL